MAAQLPRQVKLFNLYVDGDSYAGRADAITLPPLNFVTEEHRAGGMDAPKDIELGMEKLVLSMTVSDADPRLLSLIGRDDVPLVARGGVQAQGRAVEPVVINMRGLFTSTEFGEWRPGSKTANTITASLDYFKYRQRDEVFAEIDIINAVRIFGGVDQLAALRAAAGL